MRSMYKIFEIIDTASKLVPLHSLDQDASNGIYWSPDALLVTELLYLNQHTAMRFTFNHYQKLIILIVI